VFFLRKKKGTYFGTDSRMYLEAKVHVMFCLCSSGCVTADEITIFGWMSSSELTMREGKRIQQ
jgi:hypothetical protein